MIQIQPLAVVNSMPRQQRQQRQQQQEQEEQEGREVNHSIATVNNVIGLAAEDTRTFSRPPSERSSTGVAPAATPTPTTPSNLHQHHQQQQLYRYNNWQHIRLVSRAIKTIMNAAVTIFGLGVGVGLILGDSLRTNNNNGRTIVMSSSALETSSSPLASSEDAPEEATISLTPSCGGVARSSRPIRVQEPPPSSSASTMPAQ